MPGTELLVSTLASRPIGRCEARRAGDQLQGLVHEPRRGLRKETDTTL